MDAGDDRDGHQAPAFELGLALAGAISAGAYTAGVLDFLFQALSEWETARGSVGVPDHRVVLKVIAGASAGAITGALGVVALARGLHPRPFSPAEIADCYPDRYDTHQTWQCVLPTLYRTWVTLPAMIGAGGQGGLLSTSDIEDRTRKQAVRSLLNASVLDNIKRAAIDPAANAATTVTAPPVPFVARSLHLYMTVSNMRGIPFKVEFGRSTYGMQTIGDRVHYAIADLGSGDARYDNWLLDDAAKASLPISVKTLPTAPGGDLGEWDLYGTSALASSAFPVGLASRGLRFEWKHYEDRRYPIDVPAGVNIRPNFPTDVRQQFTHFAFESVDGGLVNNDPFDYAQYGLTGGPAKGPVGGQAVDRAIVMVAPFPEPPNFLPEGVPSSAMVSIIGALFPALVNQARFRASELAPAVNERDFSRFLIAPLRRKPRLGAAVVSGIGAPLKRFPIACGLLGGFGGFLDESFRAHDFQLGRRNCQQFLSTSFLVPADNTIVGRPGMTGMQPVIPLVGSAADPVKLPRWPRMSAAAFGELCRQLVKRADAVVPELVDAQSSSVKLRIALKTGWRLFLRARVLAFVRLTILADLVRRGQIEGRTVPESVQAVVTTYNCSLGCTSPRSIEDAQAVIAELANPAFDLRTADGIAGSTKLPRDFVAQVLVELTSGRTPEPVRAWRDADGYTLFERRPGFLRRQWVVRQFNRWWNAPSVN